MAFPIRDLKQRTVRAGVAVLLAIPLVAGATKLGLASSGSTAVAPATAGVQTVAPARVVATGRDSYADVVKAAAPGVVTVRVEGAARVAPTGLDRDDQEMLRRFFGRRFAPDADPDDTPSMPRTFRQRGLGSGVVVTGDGYILTNNHVVASADDIRVELADGRTFKARLVGADKPSDLALLKVEASGLPTVALGDSDAVQVGDVVLAMGNPLGIGQTVTMGIVSAKGRSTAAGDGSYEDFIQTDAPINHGNSGGALVNLKGELVGINSQIVSQSDGNIGIGFAIPVNMARHVMDDLRRDGRVHRAQLGVTIQPVTADMAESLGLKEPGGAIVSSVAPESAADHAGVKRGDILKSFNGQPVTDINSLRNRVAGAAPGSSATLKVLRDGSERSLTVKLDEAAVSKEARKDAVGEHDDKAALGVAVAPLTPDGAERAKLPAGTRGVVVRQVKPDSRAADAGIQAGDIILEANRQPVQSVEDLRIAVRKSTERPTLLLVNREGRDLYVTVRPS